MFLENSVIKKFKKVVLLSLCFFIASCANTKVIERWSDKAADKSYQNLMVIGVSDSQQVRRIFEDHLVAELKDKNIRAMPSYNLINSKQIINHDTVKNAVQDTEIDSVLVSYLVPVTTELTQGDSPVITGYSDELVSYQISETMIFNRGQSRNDEVFVIKNDLFDTKSGSITWSVKTKTVGPESIDVVITDTTTLLIEEMSNDGILK